MTDFRQLKRSMSERGITYIVRNLTTRQKINTNLIENSINAMGSSIDCLTDSDGVQQFILGITSMDSNVRVGHSP